MAEKVTPIKQVEANEVEVARISLHTSEPFIANSKTLANNTLPGARMYWEKDAHAFRIECKGKKIAWVAQTNAIAWYEK